MFGFFLGKIIVRRAQAVINKLDPKVNIQVPPDLPLPSVATIKRMAKTVSKINALEAQFEQYSDSELKAKTEEFRGRYREATKDKKEELRKTEEVFREAASNEERDDLNIQIAAIKEELKKARQAALTDILPEAFAAVREAAKRTLGMRHYDIQLLGGMVLHEGRIAEMATGEGKTLVATLPAYLNGLTGEGVHVVTVNDYLAQRDREWMGPVYEFLGLSVGVILHELSAVERQESYACDIAYGTNNEFGFDYLRDNMVIAKEEMVQAQHYFAIVDEVDSILVDEARTPLIISGPAEESTDKYYTAHDISKNLKGRRITEQEEIDAKYRNIDLTIGYDYVADEKNRSISMTEQGEEKAARMFGIDNLHDMETIEYRHHILQSLKAKEFFKRDVDYVVRDGGVLIVDEFTGRLMPGRRWSDGLHQAVEAKEGIKIERENQTLATITFQNYFRMYEKLSGMTGTAYTEANEFSQIYKLDCVVMPTNRPLRRLNHSDCVYKSVREKFAAVVEEIADCHQKGQPVLVGTISIEKSEYLSALLKQRGIPHQVLNAKYHELEAQIVAQAGRYQSVTIATNMAGRGTDIVLGGNAEFLAKSLAEQDAPEEEDESQKESRVKKFLVQFREQVKNEHQKVIEAGGLHVIGTERHESRRIDNQLRGRSGRQGDPGSSRFFVSLEDDLMRLFASDRIVSLMEKLGMEEGQVIEHPWVTRAIEVAQKRVETQNFEFRKQLLEYDNVMNKQREAIYGLRRSILESNNVRDRVMEAIEDTLPYLVDQHLVTGQDGEEPWDLDGLQVALHSKFRYDLALVRDKLHDMKPEEIKDLVVEGVKERYQQKETEVGAENMRRLEKVVLLNTLDAKWKDHLYAMDQLKGGVGLRSYGQRDPLIEYKREGYEMFQMMFSSISEEVVDIIFKVQPLQGPVRVRGVFDSLPQNFVHDEVSSFSGDTAPPAGAPQPPQPQPPQAASSSSEPYHKSGAQGREERPVSLRKRQEVQEVLWFIIWQKVNDMNREERPLDKLLQLAAENKETSFVGFVCDYSSILCLLSAVLLILSYPCFDFWPLVWIALIPMMWAFEDKLPEDAFKLGYYGGFIFFAGMFYWFISMHVTAGIPLFLSVLAVGCLVGYLSVYFGLFGYGYALVRQRMPVSRYLFIPALWAGLEFIRDRLFTGFGWASLGHSQYRFLPVIQIADITGVFGVSFLIVLVNLVLLDTLRKFFVEDRHFKDRAVWGPLLGTVAAAGLVLGYGLLSCRAGAYSGGKADMKVAVVQGNVPQRLKWIPLRWPDIMEKYLFLSKLASNEKPDLIIWPETSFPGYLWESIHMFTGMQEAVRYMIRTPVLFGAVHQDGDNYYNSAFLMTAEGQVRKKHDKLHLVPFGEYVPLRKQFPALAALIPILDFQRGQVPTLFPVMRRVKGEVPAPPPDGVSGRMFKTVPGYYSVLICFEDTVTPVARRLVLNGANLLVNITNDAWFLARKAPWLHLQAAVFQAVAHRRFLVRAANTGVTCVVSSTGEVIKYVEDEKHRKVFVEGFAVSGVRLLESWSFYTRYGDVFAYFCLVLTACGIIILKRSVR